MAYGPISILAMHDILVEPSRQGCTLICSTPRLRSFIDPPCTEGAFAELCLGSPVAQTSERSTTMRFSDDRKDVEME